LSGGLFVGIYFVIDISEVNNGMDMANMRMLVSILKESQLYMTMTHEEKIALLFKLLKEYPFLGKSQN
jgi:hypothetical protein